MDVFRKSITCFASQRQCVNQFPIGDGAAILRIAKRGRRASLEGEYWTNRDRTGDIQLWFPSRALLDE